MILVVVKNTASVQNVVRISNSPGGATFFLSVHARNNLIIRSTLRAILFVPVGFLKNSTNVTKSLTHYYYNVI